MSMEVEALLEQILDELKGLREDFNKHLECDVAVDLLDCSVSKIYYADETKGEVI